MVVPMYLLWLRHLRGYRLVYPVPLPIDHRMQFVYCTCSELLEKINTRRLDLKKNNPKLVQPYWRYFARFQRSTTMVTYRRQYARGCRKPKYNNIKITGIRPKRILRGSPPISGKLLLRVSSWNAPPKTWRRFD